MIRRLLSLLLFASLLVGCASFSQQPVRSTDTPPHLATTPVPVTDTPIPSATATSAPTPTPPSSTVSFCLLRIEYTTTSNWTRLSLGSMEGLLTARLIAVAGHPGTAAVRISPTDLLSLELNRVEEDMFREQPWSISMTVDIALDPQSIDQALHFVQEKGAWFDSIVRIYSVSQGRQLLIREVRQTDEFARFSVDLSPFRAVTATTLQLYRPDHLIWAVYYAMSSDPEHGWDIRRLTDPPLSPYAADDPSVLRRQILQAKAAGIDGFIVSWWSSPDDWWDRCLQEQLEIAQQNDFHISLMLETMDNPHNRVWELDSIRRTLAYAITRYGNHPAFMRLDGKPVIFVYASQAVPLDTWASLFADLESDGLPATYVADSYDPAVLDTFAGLFNYAVFQYPHLAELYSRLGIAIRNRPLLDDLPHARIWAATVHPGFENSYWASPPSLVVKRDDGAFYRATFEAALASDPDWIVITSWNEFTENTHIEPSQLYGDLYLRITREFADRWKSAPTY